MSKEETKELVEFVIKSMTAEEFLLSVEDIKVCYTGVTGFKRSMIIADEVITKLTNLKKDYQEKIEKLQQSDIKIEEKNKVLVTMLSEKADIKLAKITEGELEHGEKIKAFALNPIFISKIRDIIQ